MCVALSICVNLLMYLSLCVGPHFLVHLSTGLSHSVCEQMCVCVCCFNPGGQAAANSSLEGGPRGASGRIWRPTASLEHRLAHNELGRSSWWSPEAACQAPCTLPSSCPSSLSLKVSPGPEGVRTGRRGKARRSAFSSLRLSPNRKAFSCCTLTFLPNNEKWPPGYSNNNNNNKIIATTYCALSTC